jgi:glycosyltransferase involved in cell wall biosynthesis
MDSVSIVAAASKYDTIIVSNAGFENCILSPLWRLYALYRAKTRRSIANLIILDLIFVRATRLDFIYGWGLRSVTKFLCIRTGDIDTLARRYHVDANKCELVLMPAPNLDPDSIVVQRPLRDGTRYIYSAGEAFRDWELLLRMARLLDCKLVVATRSIDTSTLSIPPNVILKPPLRPDEGRPIMRGAELLVMAFLDTDRSCGPTVILDALALGLPIVSTDTNGARDYVIHGVTGLLSPPGDPNALATNVRALLDDPDMRARMGVAARAFAETKLDRASFEERVSGLVHAALAEIS